MRAELESWNLPDSALDDPGTTLLRMITQSRMRADFYASLLQRQYDESDQDEQAPAVWYEDDEDGAYSLPGPVIPRWVAGLIGFKYGSAGKDGKIYATEEGVRALIDLEYKERRMLKDLCEAAIRAKVSERQIELAEAQAAMMYQIMVRAVEGAGLGQDVADRIVAQMAGAIRGRQALET